MNRISRFIPYWLAWPAGALSTLAAFGAAGLLFYVMAFADGDLALVPIAAGLVVGAGALWFLADTASGNRPL